MGLAALHAQLKIQLAANAGLTAWAADWLDRRWTLIDGNREVEKIEPREHPALLFELGDLASEIEVGGYSQRMNSDALLRMAAVWHEPDPARAFAQRVALGDLVTQALMADYTVGDTCGGLWVARIQPAQAANPAVHVMRFDLAGDYDVTAA